MPDGPKHRGYGSRNKKQTLPANRAASKTRCVRNAAGNRACFRLLVPDCVVNSSDEAWRHPALNLFEFSESDVGISLNRP